MKKWIVLILILIVLLIAGMFAIRYLREQQFLQAHVLIGETYYEKDLETLDLSGSPFPLVRELGALKNLRQLDLRDTGLSVEDWKYLKQQLPNCDILWQLPFQGQYLSMDTQDISLSTVTQEELELLALLPELKAIDATACRDLSQISQLLAAFPQCDIAYQVELGGTLWPKDTAELRFETLPEGSLAQAMALLPQVERLTVVQPVEDLAAMEAVLAQWPELEYTYSILLYGHTVPNTATELDFSREALGSTEEMHSAMAHLKNLTHVEMCGCGIPDEEMGQLTYDFPDTKFVWEVSMGDFTLRTDIIYFMPWQYNYHVTDDDADTLKYLTDLICLDFGHMNISRTDWLAYMPKLQFLLMADTPITDLSPVAGLKELKFVELFMTHVRDFSPLLECPNLVDLNICYTYPDDPMVFCQMTQLENFWFRGFKDEKVIAEYRKALPNTRLVMAGNNYSSTGAGWRKLPNYYEQRDIMGMWYMEG